MYRVIDWVKYGGKFDKKIPRYCTIKGDNVSDGLIAATVMESSKLQTCFDVAKKLNEENERKQTKRSHLFGRPKHKLYASKVKRIQNDH